MQADADNDSRQRLCCMSKSEVVLVLNLHKLCGYSYHLAGCMHHMISAFPFNHQQLAALRFMSNLRA